jgi:hypothetical protein
MLQVRRSVDGPAVKEALQKVTQTVQGKTSVADQTRANTLDNMERTKPRPGDRSYREEKGSKR